MVQEPFTSLPMHTVIADPEFLPVKTGNKSPSEKRLSRSAQSARLPPFRRPDSGWSMTTWEPLWKLPLRDFRGDRFRGLINAQNAETLTRPVPQIDPRGRGEWSRRVRQGTRGRRSFEWSRDSAGQRLHPIGHRLPRRCGSEKGRAALDQAGEQGFLDPLPHQFGQIEHQRRVSCRFRRVARQVDRFEELDPPLRGKRQQAEGAE